MHDPAPDRRAIEITVGRKFVAAPSAFELGIFAVALEHQGRCAPDVDLRDHRTRLSRSAPLADFVYRRSTKRIMVPLIRDTGRYH